MSREKRTGQGDGRDDRETTTFIMTPEMAARLLAGQDASEAPTKKMAPLSAPDQPLARGVMPRGRSFGRELTPSEEDEARIIRIAAEVAAVLSQEKQQSNKGKNDERTTMKDRAQSVAAGLVGAAVIGWGLYPHISDGAQFFRAFPADVAAVWHAAASLSDFFGIGDQ